MSKLLGDPIVVGLSEKQEEKIWVNLSEYKELLEIKGRYYELKSMEK